MKLSITKNTLKYFYECVYYSTIIDYFLWNKKTSIVIEPIITLQIEDFIIIKWKLIDEWIDQTFNMKKIRNQLENEIKYIDGSDLEQILFPISENVYELGDNPIIYPRERLAKLVREIIPRNPNTIEFINGISHFHPFGEAQFSDIDITTLKKFSHIMGKYGKPYIIGLIIANDSTEIINNAKKTKNQFVEYMMNDLSNSSFKARIFYPNGLEKNLKISIE